MKTVMLILLPIFSIFFFKSQIFSQTRTVTVTGNQNWSALFPTATNASEDIIILTADRNDNALVINLPQVTCRSLTIGESNAGNGNKGSLTITFNGNRLDVVNNLTFYHAGEDSRNRTINIGSGTLVVGNDFSNSNNIKNTTNTISITTGTLQVGGAWTMGARATFEGGTGLVEFNGANQTLPNVSYANLSLSGSGTKTFPSLANVSNPSVSNNPIWTIQELKIYSNVTVSIGYPGTLPTEANRTYRVAKLYLWESNKLVGQNSGYYKGIGLRSPDPYTTAITKAALGSSTGLFNAAQAALPVNLTSFTAKPTTDNKVSLGWVTAAEQVNKGFRIERQDGFGEGKFEQIGFVRSKAKDGNSQTALNYNFIDAAPKTGAISFYRLVQEDLDGKLTYTEVRKVKMDGQSIFILYPNPSSGLVNINKTVDGKKLNIHVIDKSGRIVSQFSDILENNIRINIEQSGVYMIKMMYPETGEQSIQRIVVQK